MEQCLGDQQFVTLLLYLEDICIFALSIEEMLDWIDLVFNRLKEFHLKIKPKNVTSLTPVFYSWAMCYHWKEYLQTPKKVDKVWDWPIPTNTKEVHSFLGLASYYWRFIPKFAKIAQCLHELVGPTSNKHKKQEVRWKENWLHLPKLLYLKNLNGCLNINKPLMHSRKP